MKRTRLENIHRTKMFRIRKKHQQLEEDLERMEKRSLMIISKQNNFLLLMLILEQIHHSYEFEKVVKLILYTEERIDVFHTGFSGSKGDVYAISTRTFKHLMKNQCSYKKKSFIINFYQVWDYDQKVNSEKNRRVFLKNYFGVNTLDLVSMMDLVFIFMEKSSDEELFYFFCKKYFFEKRSNDLVKAVSMNQKNSLKKIRAVFKCVEMYFSRAKLDIKNVLGLKNFIYSFDSIQTEKKRVLKVLSQRIKSFSNFEDVIKVVINYFSDTKDEFIPFAVLEFMNNHCNTIDISSFEKFFDLCENHLENVKFSQAKIKHLEKLLDVFFQKRFLNIRSEELVKRDFLSQRCSNNNQQSTSELYDQIMSFYSSYIFKNWNLSQKKYSFDDQAKCLKIVISKIWGFSANNPSKFSWLVFTNALKIPEVGLHNNNNTGFFHQLITELIINPDDIVKVLHHFVKLTDFLIEKTKRTSAKLSREELEYLNYYEKVIIEKIHQLQQKLEERKITPLQFRRLKNIYNNLNSILLCYSTFTKRRNCSIKRELLEKIEQELSQIKESVDLGVEKLKTISSFFQIDESEIPGITHIDQVLDETPVNELEVKVKKYLQKVRRTISNIDEMKYKKKIQKLEKEKKKIEKENERLRTKTRLDLKLEEIEDENLWTYNPTKYATVNVGKLEFHHNIYKYPKFICTFNPRIENKFQSEESYEETTFRCDYFENVIVCLSEDKELKIFIDDIRKKYLEDVRSELSSKGDSVSTEFIELMKRIIFDVHHFFVPQDGILTTEEQIRDSIRAIQQENSGNNLYLGDLFQKYGFCRHRSTMLKLVCDSLGISSRMECIEGYHSWNCLMLKEMFFFADVTRFENRLFKISDYYKELESEVPKVGLNQGRMIKKLVNKNKAEERRISKIKKFMTNPKDHREEFCIKSTEKGGFGDVTLIEVLTKGGKLFKRGEILAVKEIEVQPSTKKKKEEETEGEDEVSLEEENEEEEEEENVKTKVVSRRIAIREAINMKILNHPCVIESIGYWESEDDDNIPYVNIAMRGLYKHGRSFLKSINNNKDMKKTEKLTEVIYFLIEVARGLRYLSTLNFTHLDLKLENVMIQWEKEKKQITDVRIIDFGSAKNNDIKTSSSNFMTTEVYDAPEIKLIKRKKEIKEKVREMKIEMNKVNRNLKIIQDLVNRTCSIFMKLSQVEQLEKEFHDLCDTCDSLKNEVQFRFSSEERKKLKEKIELQKMIKKVQVTTQKEESPFDCQADVFSFGKMMEEFQNEGLLPWELRTLQEKCVEFDRNHRPSIKEIILDLQQQLSFFNERLKEKKR